METRENILMKEYVRTYRKCIYRPLKLTGFCRFDIVNDQIVQLTNKSVIYNMFVLILMDCIVAFLLYSSIFLGNYLKIPDGLAISHFALFANVILLNITFINRRSGLDLVEHCLKIDTFLGIQETAFMRIVALKSYVASYCMVGFFNICCIVFLYRIYKVSTMIHIFGSQFFFWLIFAYDDFAFALMLFAHNSMRVRYLNVRLLKLAEIHENFLPNQSIFYIVFWNKKFDKLVKFNKKTSIEEFNKAYKMCFDLIKALERYYRFPYFCGVWTIAMGSFVAVQTFIMRVKNPTAMNNEHTYIIVAWVVLSWAFLILMAIYTDMFQHQIQQTKLICSYIQLKQNQPDNIYLLSKTVLGTIQMRHALPNIYNLFYFDSGFILRIAASTLVYITVQLQLAFPRLPHNTVRLNETSH